MFFIDTNNPKFSDIQKAYYQCHKNWIAIKILIGRGARKSAISLAKHTLKYTKKYEFTEISLDLLRRIRYNIAMSSGSLREYNQSVSEINQFEKIFQAENQASSYFEDFIFKLRGSTNPNEKLL